MTETTQTEPTMTEPTPTVSNWAGNHVYAARRLCRPATLAELTAILRRGGPVRVLGTRHSFSDIADADTLLSLSGLSQARSVRVDSERMTVRVGAAATYAELARELNAHGLALANLASLPHISVAGATATATHGSGDQQGNLSTAVVGMTLLSARGELVELGPGDPRLPGAGVHLGLLGVVLDLTLAVVPHFEVAQRVYPGLGWAELLDHLDACFALGYSVSVFHRLRAEPVRLWCKTVAGTEAPAEVLGVAAAELNQHPIQGLDAQATTPQLGVAGDWSERLPHFRSGFTPSSGEEIQSELFVDRRDAGEAVRRLLEISDRLAPDLLVGELRTVAADELWMSPQYGRDSLGLHFTWRREPERVSANVALIESALESLAARPHWGKIFSIPADRLARAYPRAGDFARLIRELDPDRSFVNAWAARVLPFLFDG